MRLVRWGMLFVLVLFFVACGEEGVAGKNALVKLSDEPAGEICPEGGIKIESGIDLDRDGVLDPEEVKDIQYVCGDQGGAGSAGCTVTDNGDGTTTIACDGQGSVTVREAAESDGCTVVDNKDGTHTITCDGVEVVVSDGQNGAAGHNSLIVLEEAAAETCPNGGQKVTVGIDMDDDGILDVEEISTTRYICNGVDGHDSLTTITPVAAGEECAAGGYTIKNGVDTDDDGTLDEGEKVNEVVICNGVDGADGHNALTEVTTLASGEGGCVAGGHLFRTGVDLNDNGVLDDGEYEEVTVCNGEKGDPGEDGVCAGNSAPVVVDITIPDPDGSLEGTYRLDIPYTVTVNATDADGDELVYKAIGGYATIAPGAEPNQFVVTPHALGGPFSFAVVVSDGCQITMGDFVIGEVWDETDPPWFEWMGDDIWFEEVTETSFTTRWQKAWDDWSEQDELEYKVVYSTDPDDIDDIDEIEQGGGILAMNWTQNVDTAPIAGLTLGGTYFVTVLVRDKYHNIAQYEIDTITMPDLTPPVTDGGISFSDITETSLTVSWDSALDNLSDLSTIEYKVVFSEDPEEIDTETEVSDLMSGDWRVLVDWETEVYSYDLDSLLDGMIYYFNVLVRDAAGNTVLYGVRSVTTLDTTPPDDVANLYAVGLNGRVCFRWDDLGDHSLDHYAVTWTPDAPTEPKEVPADSFFRCIDGLTNDTEYTFSIVAVDRGHNESANPTTVAMTPTDPGMGYASTGSNNAATKLYRLDPSTAETSLIGDTGIMHGTGLAVHPDSGDLLLAATDYDFGDAFLYSLDPTDGVATLVGPLGSDLAYNPDLAFSTEGVLYGWSENEDDLIVIDTATGDATWVGDSSVDTWGTGLAFDISGELWVKPGNEMWRLDPVTGAGTYVTEIDVQYFEDEHGNGYSELRNALDFSAENGVGFSVVRTEDSTYLYAFTTDDMVAVPIGDLKVKNVNAVEFQPAFKPIDQHFSGIQRFVPADQLTDWEVCYKDTYADSGDALTDILTACNGDNLMLACRPVGSSLLTLAAWAKRDDVTFDTGIDETTVQNSNGVDWYFSESYSWGFAPEGAGVNKDSCDYNNGMLGQQAIRLCWHTESETIATGYRCGDNELNDDNTWERVILHYTPPE